MPTKSWTHWPARSANCRAEGRLRGSLASIAAADIEVAKQFYQDILGLDLLMDLGWITTFGSSERMILQVSFASEGGSGVPVPDCHRVRSD